LLGEKKTAPPPLHLLWRHGNPNVHSC
jgi:hypothetical protein